MAGEGGGDGRVQLLGNFGEFLEDGLFVARVPVHCDDLWQGQSLLSGGFQLFAQNEGGEVAAGPGAGVAAVGEGNLHEEDLGRRRMCKEGEQSAARVAGKGRSRRSLSHHETHRRRAVGNGQGQNLYAADVEGPPGGYGAQPIFRVFRRGPDGEVGVQEAEVLTA